MQQHCDPLPISASGTDRCACTAANPDYEAVTNGWCAWWHVANAERGEWESWKVIRDASPLPAGNMPLFAPKSISSTRILPRRYSFFFLIRDIRRDPTLTQCSSLKREVANARRYNYNKRCILCFVLPFRYISDIAALKISKSRIYKDRQRRGSE